MNQLTKNVQNMVQFRPKSSILMGGQPDFCRLLEGVILLIKHLGPPPPKCLNVLTIAVIFRRGICPIMNVYGGPPLRMLLTASHNLI